MEIEEARGLAHRLLADDLPQRWTHVLGVAATAEQFRGLLPESELLIVAAYLHDIGYAPSLVDTGFHQVDGARYLRRLGWDENVVNLVAHHSAAAAQAVLGGWIDLIEIDFPFDPSLPHRYLQFCDLTTGFNGEPVTIEQRLDDPRARNADNQPKLDYIDRYENELRALVAEIKVEHGLVPPDDQSQERDRGPISAG